MVPSVKQFTKSSQTLSLLLLLELGLLLKLARAHDVSLKSLARFTSTHEGVGVDGSLKVMSECKTSLKVSQNPSLLTFELTPISRVPNQTIWVSTFETSPGIYLFSTTKMRSTPGS